MPGLGQGNSNDAVRSNDNVDFVSLVRENVASRARLSENRNDINDLTHKVENKAV